MELQPQNSCNQKQREIFTRMLREARKRAEAELESDSDLDHRIEEEFLPKLARDQGASDLIGKVRTLRNELEEAEEALSHMGFSCSKDSISLKWNAPKKLHQALEEQKRSARKERQRSLRNYDLAILGVWSAKATHGAQRIVESLL